MLQVLDAVKALVRWLGTPCRHVARMRAFYLYEFLLAISVITLLFQVISLMNYTVSRESRERLSDAALHNLLKSASDSEGSRALVANNAATVQLPDVGLEKKVVNTSRLNVSGLSSEYPCRNDSSAAYSVLVFGGMNVIKQWQELRVLVEELEQVEKNKHSMKVSCPYTRTTPPEMIEEEGRGGAGGIACQSSVTVTLSSNMAELSGKDVVVLGMSPYSLKIKTKVMRNKVTPDTLFVFYGVETPLRMVEWIPDAGRQPIHGVWSYIDSSETTMPYGRYREYPETRDVDLGGLVARKTKLVAWMGSNCVKQVFWPRMAFIQELQKYVDVDTYGKCGNLSCLPRMSEHCQSLMGQYKFYLALENAECIDYMTEKFWDTGLLQGAVPVVYGALKEDYERVAPPGSFIHVSDFESVESLAKYLLLLDRNDILYQKYFNWRRKGTVEMVFPPLVPSSFCDLIKQHHLLKRGMLGERDLGSTSWYNGCRHQVAKSYPSEDFNNWRPWK